MKSCFFNKTLSAGHIFLADFSFQLNRILNDCYFPPLFSYAVFLTDTDGFFR